MIHEVNDTQQGYCYRHRFRFAMCNSNELKELVAYKSAGLISTLSPCTKRKQGPLSMRKHNQTILLEGNREHEKHLTKSRH